MKMKINWSDVAASQGMCAGNYQKLKRGKDSFLESSEEHASANHSFWASSFQN